MSIEIPDPKTILQHVDIADYGDEIPNSSSDGFHRGGAFRISSVLPAISSALGNPVETAIHHDPRKLQETLGFPSCKSAIVVLVDGMGFWNIATRSGHAPYLRSLMHESANARPISTCQPSTTVVAMAAFGTGTCPGMTAMTGYTQLNPYRHRISQMIQFRNAIPPLELQREPTVFERLSDEGVRVTSSGLPEFAGSALTQAALRGSTYIGREGAEERILEACKAAREPGLTYLYIRDVDKAGHEFGWESEPWIAEFETVDSQLALLHRRAPKGTLIVIIADHGMIEVDPSQRIDMAQNPELLRGVKFYGGEPRFVMAYADEPEDSHEIAARWCNELGESAEVLTKHEAIDAGLFGPVKADVEPMIGDVLAIMNDRATLVDSRVQKDRATRLPGVHGSRSMMESDIPCLMDLA
ncbi:alkaline phosphatase family protein [Bifidobacterium aquikefiri]|uniref:alkaline phosphatase family protein n=1 Tax=Bifidobacterium aquikefiri TaxID=1653207 RepID=UPI0039E8024E